MFYISRLRRGFDMRKLRAVWAWILLVTHGYIYPGSPVQDRAGPYFI
jgi:hypothetical protein